MVDVFCPLLSATVAEVIRYRNCAMFMVVVPMVTVVGSALLVSIDVFTVFAAVRISVMVKLVELDALAAAAVSEPAAA